jgi:hypothetical protein
MGALIDYPDRSVLAVFDDSVAADAAEAALRGLGVPAAEVVRLDGAAAAAAFDGTGRQRGPRARIRRALDFSLMDQMPAMAWYEAALRDGRIVLAIPTRDRTTTLRVVEALKGAGGHFINRFGRLATEEFARWRGAEPAIPDLLK